MPHEHTTAWYKQFWPWFLIALPGSVVVASIATIIIASHNPDSVVVDDYYKAGLAINRDLSREQLADRLNIKSTLQFSNDNKVRIILGAADQARPASLLLRFMHPTQPEKDQTITLELTDTMLYSGNIHPVTDGTWNVAIEADSPSWRIQARINIDSSNSSYTIR